MKLADHTKKELGSLIKKTRAASMDQQELALRCGSSINTISRLERGQNVSSDILFAVLEHLELLDPILAVIEQQHALVQKNPLRKSASVNTELPNDF